MKPSQFDARLSDLENEIAKLRAIYEQWFQGIERVPPVRQRERLDRQVRQLRREAPNNTALRFKYQTIFQRWITFTQYWDRISRRIEEGTYARDIRRAKRRRAMAERQTEPRDEGPKSVEVEMDLDMDVDAEINAALEALGSVGPTSKPPPTQPTAISLPNMDLDEHPAESKRPPPAARPQPPRPPPPPGRTFAKPPAPPPGRPAPPAGRPAPPRPPRPPARAEGLRDDDVRRIFDRYVEARKQVGKRPDGVSYEKLASQIRKMEPKLQKKHAGKRIDFEVVVKDGKVGLKPVARPKPGDD